jgi:hypothetical protein
MPNIDEIPTSTASNNVKTDPVSFHWPDNNGKAAIATVPSEIQLEIIFHLVLPTAERLFYPDRAISSDDLDAIERLMERGVFRTAISEELKPYLDACGAARACWIANRTVSVRRVARSILAQTAPLRKKLQRELVLARARMVLWKAAMERDDSIDFSIRMMEAKIGLREAEIRCLLEERRQDVLDRLDSFE